MLLYIFKQVIKTLFQLPTPILLWMISYVSVYRQEKYTHPKQKLSKTLFLIICSSVSNDVGDRLLRGFSEYLSAIKMYKLKAVELIF